MPEAFGWSLLVIVLMLGAFAGVVYLRKWLREPEEPSDYSTFTLGDLRRYLKEGKLTQEEFDRLSSQIIASARKNAPDPLARGRAKPPGAPDADDSGRASPPGV